ncbi:hypothetical protein GIY56_12150 [Paracoccus sp. YIM 132242]|uniref:PepSY domain-containing protein n=1 Tax=Paracoccus lichenicola TaxID=2665644 RepID=A0A6L6HPG4_9RHOB|nr:PepSY domain-containing protein [Paracoccus lichenicola]MTE01047.1 hypothetical protein [Paracoccus lichenicola]
MKPLIPVLVLALGPVGPALAQDAARPLSAIIADLEAQGYRIADIDVDRASIDVDATAPDGRRVDLRVDSGSGAILAETRDD